jgi:hypothetical protein
MKGIVTGLVLAAFGPLAFAASAATTKLLRADIDAMYPDIEKL